ncbi:hypothetical protein Vafri_21598, partial [Volvox africanus]
LLFKLNLPSTFHPSTSSSGTSVLCRLCRRGRTADTRGTFPSPVRQWMDTALQRRRREQHLANIRQPQLPSASIGGLISGQQTTTQTPYQPAQMAAIPAVLQIGGPGAVGDSGASGISVAATLAPNT